MILRLDLWTTVVQSASDQLAGLASMVNYDVYTDVTIDESANSYQALKPKVVKESRSILGSVMGSAVENIHLLS